MKKNILKTCLLIFGLTHFSVSYAQWTLPLVPVGTSDLQSVNFASETTVFAVGYGGSLIKSIDEGKTWTSLISPTNSDLYSVMFLDETTGFVMGDLGKIYKTTDGGLTWNLKTTGTVNSIYSSYGLSDKTTIFAVGDQIILKSTDAGETWVNQAIPVNNEAFRRIEFVKSNESIAYLSGTNNGLSTYIYKTTDGGQSWLTQTLPTSSDGDPVNLFGMSVVDATNVFVCGGSKRISKTSNGTSWTNINNSGANFYRACSFSSSTNGYVVGGNGKILQSTNGSSFTSETSGTTALLTSITSNINGTYLATGGSGTGIIVRKQGTLKVDIQSDIKLNIHPNPTANIVTVETEKLIKNITLFSMDGRQIAFYEGVNEFNISKLNQGTYLVNVLFENGTISESKIVKN